MDIKIGDIVLTTNGKFAVIIGYEPRNFKYPYLYKFGAVPTTYKGSASNFKARLGACDMTAFNAACVTVPPTTKVGTDIDILVPAPLRGVKVGDTITVMHNGRPTPAIYRGYFRQRPNYPLGFTINGRDYKAPMSNLLTATGTPTPKRAEKDIMKDIAGVYNQLSPENLCCDGELPASQVAIRRARLMTELRQLQAELGRTVTEEEAFQNVA